jgi:hypothetical protein
VLSERESGKDKGLTSAKSAVVGPHHDKDQAVDLYIGSTSLKVNDVCVQAHWMYWWTKSSVRLASSSHSWVMACSGVEPARIPPPTVYRQPHARCIPTRIVQKPWKAILFQHGQAQPAVYQLQLT